MEGHRMKGRRKMDGRNQEKARQKEGMKWKDQGRKGEGKGRSTREHQTMYASPNQANQSHMPTIVMSVECNDLCFSIFI